MRLVEPLLPHALLGTARAGDVPSAIRAIGGVAAPVLEVVAAGGASEPPAALLRAAGVLAQCQRVGFLVTPAGDASAHPKDDAGDGAKTSAGVDATARDVASDLAEDPPPLDGPEWLPRLARVLAEGPPALQHHVLHAIARSGHRLHAQLLPAALDLAVSAPLLREAVGLALGRRGRWLAGQRTRWLDALSAPAAPSEDQWNHGRLAARSAYLRHERSHSPDVARARLESEIGQMGADERAELVGCLVVGIGPADETLLAALLVDRAVEVRRAAARLLIRLPESARSIAIADALAILVIPAATNKKRAWKIDAPEAETPLAKALGLELRPKSDELGERAFWLYQLARNAPLSFWTRHTDMTSAEVVAWAAKTDWSQALLRGMHDALLAAPDVEWARALLSSWSGAVEKVLGEPSGIQALLPWAEREAPWRERLAAEGLKAIVEIALEIADVAAPADRLTPELAALFVKHFAAYLGTSRSDFGAHERNAAVAVCAAMPDSALAPLRSIPREADLMVQLDDTVDAIENVVDVRLRLLQLRPDHTDSRPDPAPADPASAPRTS